MLADGALAAMPRGRVQQPREASYAAAKKVKTFCSDCNKFFCLECFNDKHYTMA
jgi:hypothetical protein